MEMAAGGLESSPLELCSGAADTESTNPQNDKASEAVMMEKRQHDQWAN